MANLYDIDMAIMALVDQETGEITDWEAFEALQMDRERKIENIAVWIKNLMSDAAAIREEEKALAARRQNLERMAETRKRWLSQALGGQKFSTSRCVVTFRNTPVCRVMDPAAAIEWAETHGHKDCVTYKAPDVAKTELIKLLKAGTEVPGAELAYSESVGVK